MTIWSQDSWWMLQAIGPKMRLSELLRNEECMQFFECNLFFLRCQMVPIISWYFMEFSECSSHRRVLRRDQAIKSKTRKETSRATDVKPVCLWNSALASRAKFVAAGHWNLYLYSRIANQTSSHTHTHIFFDFWHPAIWDGFMWHLPKKALLCNTFAASSRNPGLCQVSTFWNLSCVFSTLPAKRVQYEGIVRRQQQAIPFCKCWILFYFSTTLHTDHSGITNHVHREWKSEDI